ncbi:MAG: cytochrome-c peroxidase [Owenweeksia sp.]
MARVRFLFAAVSLVIITGLSQCRKDIPKASDVTWAGATPYDFQVPEGFPPAFIPADNPMTVEGIELGRFLFYDKRLSKDLSMSCGSCHEPHNAFSNRTAKSVGIHGHQTRRNSMPLFNLAWQENFFWDGRTVSLEEQALLPVTDQIELDNDWITVVARLEADSIYPDKFEKAFGPGPITKENAAKAIAQFERSIVSANSEFDQVVRLKTKGTFDDPLAAAGKAFFETAFPNGADCSHCHGIGETSYIMGSYGLIQFSNNGLKDSAGEMLDRGHEEVSGNSDHRAKFRIPSLRNLMFSSPFMHDGSIPNIDSLVTFYNIGSHRNRTTDPNMETAGRNNQWTIQQQEGLKAFLRSLSDHSFRENPAYQNPFLP